MSLVSDALKKAQRESAEREAREKGLAAPPRATPLQPFRRRRGNGAPTATLAAAAAVVLALAGVAYFFFSDSGDRSAARSSEAAAHAAETAPVKGVAGPEVRGAARIGVDGAVEHGAERNTAGDAARQAATSDSPPKSLPAFANERTGAPADRQAPAADPTPPSLPASADERTGAMADRQAPAVGPTPPSLPASANPRSGTETNRQAATSKRTFVREKPAGEGAVIRLGGIAFSEVAPLAYLNGKLIGVGERVEDWTVQAIRRGEVELVRGDDRLVLTLR